MSGDSKRSPAQQSLDMLVDNTRYETTPRILVSAGGVGMAAGAGELLDALRSAVVRSGAGVRIVETGSTGMTWDEVQVTVQAGGAPDLTWSRVTPEDAEKVVGVATGEVGPEQFPPAFVWQHDPFGSVPGIHSVPYFNGQTRRLSQHFGRIDSVNVDEAVRRGAYRGLARVLGMAPDEVVDELGQAELAGRGGAYFPTGFKASGARRWLHPGQKSFLIVNAEEGEPGVYKDRTLIEGDPHLVLEGTLINAYAVGADYIFFYLNGEAPVTLRFLERAIDEARRRGLIGERILGTDFDCDIEIRLGGGGYVLGEGTALIESIDGQRNMPRLRPPFSDEWGLWDRPTVVQNVETLANIPLIVDTGAERYAEQGVQGGRGTKLVCVAGNVERPCVAEIEIGTTLRTVVEDIAGGVAGGKSIGSILTGGPSGNIVSPDLLDEALVPRSDDVLLGSGNITVLDEDQPVFELVQRLTRYNADESCGKCTPCREGVPRMVDILNRIGEGRSKPGDLEDLKYLCDIAAVGSICGLGQMAPNPILSAMKHFDLPEFATAVKQEA